MAYCHEEQSSSNTLSSQSGSTAYRLHARPALTGPGLRLSAMSRPGLPFNGRHPRDPCNYMENYSFTDPGGMKGWVGLVNLGTEVCVSKMWYWCTKF